MDKRPQMIDPLIPELEAEAERYLGEITHLVKTNKLQRLRICQLERQLRRRQMWGVN